MQKIHHYSPADGAYIESDFARESPLEKGVFLIPSYATTVEPPKPSDRTIAMFSTETASWSLVPDWRGVDLFSTVDGSMHHIEQINVTPESRGLTLESPPVIADKEARMFVDGAWRVVADWRSVPLYSTTNGEAMRIHELEQLPADVGATEHAPPSPQHTFIDGAWTLDQGKVTAYEKERFDAAKANANSAINQFHSTVVSRLIGNPTQEEKDTWPLKLEAATAIDAGQPLTPAGTAFLEGAGLKTKAAKAEWAARVLAKSAGFASVAGLAERMRDAAKLAVSAATDADGVQKALDAQRAQAESAIASLSQ